MMKKASPSCIGRLVSWRSSNPSACCASSREKGLENPAYPEKRPLPQEEPPLRESKTPGQEERAKMKGPMQSAEPHKLQLLLLRPPWPLLTRRYRGRSTWRPPHRTSCCRLLDQRSCQPSTLGGQLRPC